MDRVLADRYRLRHRIGGGGMGVVFAGRDEVLQRPVAVKLLPGVDTAQRSFLREARALSRLRHPGIVQLFDAGDDDGDAYLVLELVQGQTLRRVLDEGALSPGEARRIGRELAAALAHAHEVGVVHRDLTPANVLVDQQGRVRLTDFGIARLAESTVTAGVEVWGTPAYMAPEQVAGEAVGPAADVYALGLVLLEALTGRRAFPGTPTEAGLARLHRDPPVPGDLPHPWPPLLRAMTARAPAARPHARSVASKLGAPPETLRTIALPMATPADVAAPPRPAGTPATHHAWWRRPAAAVIGLFLVSVLLLGLAAGADRSPSAPEPVATTTAEAAPRTAPVVPPPPPPEADDEDDDAEDDDEGDDRDDDGSEGRGKDKGKGKGRGKD